MIEVGPLQSSEIRRALRNAVRQQIDLWDSIQTLEELIEVDFDPLLWVETTSRLLRSGDDLSMAHVKDYLDRGPIYVDSGPRSVRLPELLFKALTRAVDRQIKFWNVLEQLKRFVTVGFDPPAGFRLHARS